VAEGVKSCGSLLALAESNEIYAPLVEAVHAVIVGELSTEKMMESFVSRETKHERD
jgi:glycerol-3-phosphate dehydrogenase (NAD(P)+)